MSQLLRYRKNQKNETTVRSPREDEDHGAEAMRLELMDIWSLSDGSDTALAFPLVPAEVGAVEIDEAKSAFPASPEVWLLAWSLRRQTWRQLIAQEQLEVTFRHDAESGKGSATMRFMSDNGASVTMKAPDFLRSDAMHFDYFEENGLFHWPEYRLVNIEYLENDDSELDEYSFTSVDRVAVESHVPTFGDPWAGVPEDVQVAAASALIADLRKQNDEFHEIVTDHLDVLLAIALHPGSSAAVVDEVGGSVPAVAEAMRELGSIASGRLG